MLDIKVTIPRPFGLRVKLHVPLFGGLNFFLKLRAVAPLKLHVQQRVLDLALFAGTEKRCNNRDLQDIFRLFSKIYEKLRDLYLSPIII